MYTKVPTFTTGRLTSRWGKPRREKPKRKSHWPRTSIMQSAKNMGREGGNTQCQKGTEWAQMNSPWACGRLYTPVSHLDWRQIKAASARFVGLRDPASSLFAAVNNLYFIFSFCSSWQAHLWFLQQAHRLERNRTCGHNYRCSR